MPDHPFLHGLATKLRHAIFTTAKRHRHIVGLYVSDGDTSVSGVLGAKSPELGTRKWHWFYTQQHGDNPTYEVRLDH